MMKNHCFLFFFLCLYTAAYSQVFTVTTDKKKILIGEQLQLLLESNFPSGMQVSWFSFDSIPHLEILEKSKLDTQQNNQGTRLTQKFILTSWDSGSWQIPSFVLAGSRSAPIQIDVAFSPFDRDQPYHDVKDVLDAKKTIESKWYWYLIFAIILILLFLLFFPKEKKKTDLFFTPDPGAYKTALKQLEQLKSQQVDDPKIYYTSMINIFRTYLHRRKNIQSFSKTTDDLALQIDKLPIEKDQYKELLQTLRMSDMVKFARFIPAVKDNQVSIDTIRESINEIEQVPHVV